MAELITGNKAKIIKWRIFTFMFWQLIKICHNPFVVIQKIIQIRRLRQKVHGNPRTPKYIRSGKQYYWSCDYAGFPSDQLKEMIKWELSRLNQKNIAANNSVIPQQTVIWGITNRCPLKCTHCYEQKNIDDTDHLSLTELFTILDKIKTHGICHMQLSGGEPLARFDDLVSIIKEASNKIDCWLLTSGFGLTIERALVLKSAGLKGANISLDHWNEKLHNRFRNHDNSFEWVIKAVRNCLEVNLMVSLSLCATREFINWQNLLYYMQLATELNVHFVRILEPRQIGGFKGKNVHLGHSQVELLSHFIKQVNSLPEYRNYPVVSFPGYHQRQLGCMGAGNRYIYIDSNGNFHACPFCHGSVGNAISMPFNEAIMRLRATGCHAFKTLNTYH